MNFFFLFYLECMGGLLVMQLSLSSLGKKLQFWLVLTNFAGLRLVSYFMLFYQSILFYKFNYLSHMIC